MSYKCLREYTQNPYYQEIKSKLRKLKLTDKLSQYVVFGMGNGYFIEKMEIEDVCMESYFINKGDGQKLLIEDSDSKALNPEITRQKIKEIVGSEAWENMFLTEEMKMVLAFKIDNGHFVEIIDEGDLYSAYYFRLYVDTYSRLYANTKSYIGACPKDGKSTLGDFLLWIDSVV